MFAVNRIASPLSVLVCLGLAASSPLTCNVTKQPNGSFRYRVSQPHGPGCMTSWEDSNRTVIAHSLDRVRTNQSVTLDVCLDLLHYTRDCPEGWEETYCRVNCTLHLDQGLHLLTVNSTRICFSLKMCTNQSNIWRILAPFVLLILLIVFVLLAVWKDAPTSHWIPVVTVTAPAPAPAPAPTPTPTTNITTIIAIIAIPIIATPIIFIFKQVFSRINRCKRREVRERADETEDTSGPIVTTAF